MLPVSHFYKLKGFAVANRANRTKLERIETKPMVEPICGFNAYAYLEQHSSLSHFEILPAATQSTKTNFGR